jgi:hypothetical protein
MFNSRSNYVKFTAWTNLDSCNVSQERLLTKEILIAITSELAKNLVNLTILAIVLF